jgi:hypothetical protein
MKTIVRSSGVDDVAEVEARVGRCHVRAERALEGVLDVLGGDLAIDRRGVADARLDPDRDRPAVGRHARRAVGEVGPRPGRVAGTVGVQRAVDGVVHGVAERIVGLGGIDEVDVVGREDGQVTALLRMAGRAVVVPARARAAAAGAGADREHRDDEDREDPSW